MPTTLTRRLVVGTLCVAFLLPTTALAQRTIRCESRNYKYRFCSAHTDYRVRLVRQRSSTRCRQGLNWGYDRRGVWVDRGCDADFEVGRDHGFSGDNESGGSTGKGVAIGAGAALASVAIAAAIAGNRNKHDEKVPAWAIGTFRGYDAAERTNVEVTVLPGGSVTGVADGNAFSGHWEDKRLEAGRHRFRVERSGNGFIATDENDRNHQVVFSLIGGGYSSGGY